MDAQVRGWIAGESPLPPRDAGYKPHVSGLPASAVTGWALSPALIASFKRRITVKHILMCYTLLKIYKL